jgi:hypothetical protein
MRFILVVVLLCVLSSAASHAHNVCAKAKCEETRQKIEKVQAKMRQGYTRAQGEKMEAELRSLRAIRSQRCR